MDIQKLLNTYSDGIFALAVIGTKSTKAATEVYFRTFEKAFAERISDEAELCRACCALCMEADTNEEASTITDFKMKKKELAFCEELFVQSQKTRLLLHLMYIYEYDFNRAADIIGTPEKIAQKLLDAVSEELRALADENYLSAMMNIRVPEGTYTYAAEKFSKGDGRLFEQKADIVPRHIWTKKQKTAVTIIAIIVTVTVCIVMPLVEMLINRARDTEGVDMNQSQPSVIFTAAEETEEDKISIFD